MKLKIEDEGLKVFARALKFLSGIGNEIFFEAQTQGLTLKAVNLSKTSFCAITLLKGFFESYELIGTSFNECHCSVSARPLFSILKSIKNMKSINIRLDAQKELLVTDTLLPKKVEHANSISILDNENLDCPGQSKNLKNVIICHSKVLSVLLQSFPKNIKEISLDITSNRIEISNHINHEDKDVQTIRLNYKFESKEFIDYTVSEHTKLILSSKDFLSIIELADSSCGDLKIAFSKNGRPISIAVGTDPLIQVEMILSSLREDALKSVTKPPDASSYKELIGGYLEGHTANKQQLESQEVLTDSSMLRAISPSVASYGKSSDRFKRSTAKRKSTESAGEETNLKESGKKSRNNETLTQNEEREVSQIIEALSGLGSDEGDDCIGMFGNNSNQHNESNNERSSLGQEPIKDGLDQKLVGTETDPDSASFRFDISKAQILSGGLVSTLQSSGSQLENNFINSSREKEIGRKSESQKARNAESIKYGKEFLELKRVRKMVQIEMRNRETKAPDSDPDSES